MPDELWNTIGKMKLKLNEQYGMDFMIGYIMVSGYFSVSISYNVR